MKLLHRYLLKDVLHYFVMFLMVFAVIMLVSEIFDTRSEFLQNSPPLRVIVSFLVVSLPAQLAQTLPLIGLIATMMAYGLMAKNREVLAMLAAGVSYRSLAVPALTFGLALSVFAFWFNEWVVPASNARSRYIEKVVIGGRSESVITQRSDQFIKGEGQRFYFMQEYLPEKHLMVFPTILDLNEDGSGLRERIEAVEARMARSEGKKRYWDFRGAQQWVFNPDGTIASYQKFAGPYEIPLEEGLDKRLGKSQKADEMSLGELIEYVRLLGRSGGEKVDTYATQLYTKFAFPVSCLLMALLGFAAVLDLNAKRFARSAFTGLLIAIGYYILQNVLRSIGTSGHVPPIIGGFGAVVVFAAVVLYMLNRLERKGA